ncbi:hypothetical protein ACK2FT_12880 [Clostridioides difficile]
MRMQGGQQYLILDRM